MHLSPILHHMPGCKFITAYLTFQIAAKAPCVPRFVTPIEGNAVEESARVFFEGIVDSQPQPVFTWYFDDEEIVPGQDGFEEAEIHHSRKMSTLILKVG